MYVYVIAKCWPPAHLKPQNTNLKNGQHSLRHQTLTKHSSQQSRIHFQACTCSRCAHVRVHVGMVLVMVTVSVNVYVYVYVSVNVNVKCVCEC